MDLGERISPSSVSDLRITLFALSLRAKQERPLTDFSSILLSLLEAKFRAASM